jgi:hypothetical protein
MNTPRGEIRLLITFTLILKNQFFNNLKTTEVAYSNRSHLSKTAFGMYALEHAKK